MVNNVRKYLMGLFAFQTALIREKGMYSNEEKKNFKLNLKHDLLSYTIRGVVLMV